jgi:hypothetical protein
MFFCNMHGCQLQIINTTGTDHYAGTRCRDDSSNAFVTSRCPCCPPITLSCQRMEM